MVKVILTSQIRSQAAFFGIISFYSYTAVNGLMTWYWQHYTDDTPDHGSRSGLTCACRYCVTLGKRAEKELVRQVD